MKVVDFVVPQTSNEAFRVQSDRLPYFYDKLHHHVEFQIMLILKGAGTLIAGDYVGRFEEGDLFLLGSNQPHVFRNDEAHYWKKGKLTAESISIYFNEEYLGSRFWHLQEMAGVRTMLERALQGMRILGETKARVIDIINQLNNVQGIDRLIRFFECLQLIAASNEAHSLSVTAPVVTYLTHESKRMNDILHFTFNESHRKIYIDEVARIAHLSVEAFCRYFKLRTRKTYTTFLNEVRISNACKLLIENEVSIQDVCYKTGFNNLSNFNRIFKKVTGKNPSQYMKASNLRPL
jgi:AraC-like DNA-binding protein